MSAYVMPNTLLNSTFAQLRPVDATKFSGTGSNFQKIMDEWTLGTNTDFYINTGKITNLNTALGISNIIGQSLFTTYYGDISNCTGFPSGLSTLNTALGGYSPQGGVNEFKASESVTSGQSVLIDCGGGTFLGTDGSIYSPVADTTVSLAASDLTNPRWDLISLDASAGSFTLTAGTAAAYPTQPAIPAGTDGICYIYRRAGSTGNTIYNRDILDIRLVIHTKNLASRFSHNFSIWGNDGSGQAVQSLTINMLQQVPYGVSFDVVNDQQTFLHKLDTFLVNADSPPGEIVYGGAGWATTGGASYWFGAYKETTTLGDTAIFSFSGVEVWAILENFTGAFHFDAELSIDGGVTWINKRTIVEDATTTDAVDATDWPVILYEQLPYGDYKVRLTCRGTSIRISHFAYVTYVCQTASTMQYFESTDVKGIAALPPITTHLVGTWTNKGAVAANFWNGTYSQSNTSADFVEFKFYGSKVWLITSWRTDGACSLSFTIDGVTTHCRNSGTIASLDSQNNSRSLHLRLDDGSLPEGIHIVKVIRGAEVNTEYFACMGWDWYSAKAPTTVARQLICGELSEEIVVDNSRFSFSGAGWGATSENAASWKRRIKSTTTQNDYCSITTPNNDTLRAIYFVGQCGTTSVGIKTTLAGGLTRYIYPTLASTMNGVVWLLYDSFFDGPLHNQELRVIKDVAGNSMFFEGVIFEYGAVCGKSSILCMNKHQKYFNTSTDYDQVVSNSFRLDIYGVKSDMGRANLPMVHTGWHTIYTSNVSIMSIGVPFRTFLHQKQSFEGPAGPLAPVGRLVPQNSAGSAAVAGLTLVNSIAGVTPGAVRAELVSVLLDRVY